MLGLAAETPDLQPADQHKNEQDDQHQPEATGRAIAPTSTVPPPGQATNQQDDENDKKKSADGHASLPTRRRARLINPGSLRSQDRPFSHDRSLAVQFEYKGLGGDNSMLYYHPYF